MQCSTLVRQPPRPLLSILSAPSVYIYGASLNGMFHAGGDEVNVGCWERSAGVLAFMEQRGMGGNMTLLNNYYIQRLLQIVGANTRSLLRYTYN
eukprot:COSAG05_NODE_138_length_16837_cov_344.961286_11_plen_94_part_00